MLEALKSLDTQIFLAVNGAHCDFLDFTMFWASNKVIWAPFYVFIAYLLIQHYRRTGWVILLMGVLLVVICDQVSVHLFKDVFERLRPCHDPSLAGLVRLPGGRCGGQYGFVSSHAVNHFAIAVYTGYFLNRKIRHFLLVLIIWAAIVSFSRIYLGVHYPGDVIAGAIVGTILAGGMIVWAKNLTSLES